MNVFGKLVHIFGKLVNIPGKLVHVFGWKLVSRTSKQVSRHLGPLWQSGVRSNDTNLNSRPKFIQYRIGVWKCPRSLDCPVLDKMSGPMGAPFRPVLGWGLATA